MICRKGMPVREVDHAVMTFSSLPISLTLRHVRMSNSVRHSTSSGPCLVIRLEGLAGLIGSPDQGPRPSNVTGKNTKYLRTFQDGQKILKLPE
jgi:hypothetical protein